jgi:hypothetical protein
MRIISTLLTEIQNSFVEYVISKELESLMLIFKSIKIPYNTPIMLHCKYFMVLIISNETNNYYFILETLKLNYEHIITRT